MHEPKDPPWVIELIIAGLLIWWAFVVVGTTHGECVDVPCVRPQRGPGILSDIDARLRDRSIQSGERTCGRGHYGGHGLNSQIRNERGGAANAAYVGDGKALVLPEPRNVRLSEVVQLRGMLSGALQKALVYWEHQPLYLLDELSAYYLGTRAGIEAGDRSSRTRGSYQAGREVLRHCQRLVEVCRARGYPHTDELADFVACGEIAFDQLGRHVR